MRGRPMRSSATTTTVSRHKNPSVVIDTSAVIAVLLGEPESDAFGALLATEPDPVMSAATLLEASIVMQAKKGAAGTGLLDSLLAAAGVRIIAVDAEQAMLARDAFTRYGKGQRNTAGLNFGDCFSYALAHSTGRPLLYKGAGFAATDIQSAGD